MVPEPTSAPSTSSAASSAWPLEHQTHAGDEFLFDDLAISVSIDLIEHSAESIVDFVARQMSIAVRVLSAEKLFGIKSAPATLVALVDRIFSGRIAGRLFGFGNRILPPIAGFAFAGDTIQRAARTNKELAITNGRRGAKIFGRLGNQVGGELQEFFGCLQYVGRSGARSKVDEVTSDHRRCVVLRSSSASSSPAESRSINLFAILCIETRGDATAEGVESSVVIDGGTDAIALATGPNHVRFGNIPRAASSHGNAATAARA